MSVSFASWNPVIAGRRPADRLGDQGERVRARMEARRDKPDARKGVAGFAEDDWRRLNRRSRAGSVLAAAFAPADATPNTTCSFWLTGEA